MNLAEITSTYGRNYHSSGMSDAAIVAWRGVTTALLETLPYCNNWCDVGCGGGGLVAELRARGKNAYGIEGSMEALGFAPVPIILWDLRTPLLGLPAVHVVTCFDVAEHVGNAVAVVDTCIALSRDYVVFGAATPDQAGYEHIDLRPHSEWSAMFNDRGYDHATHLTIALRDRINAINGTNYLWWVAKNAHVYRNAKGLKLWEQR